MFRPCLKNVFCSSIGMSSATTCAEKRSSFFQQRCPSTPFAMMKSETNTEKHTPSPLSHPSSFSPAQTPAPQHPPFQPQRAPTSNGSFQTQGALPCHAAAAFQSCFVAAALLLQARQLLVAAVTPNSAVECVCACTRKCLYMRSVYV